MLSLGMLIFIGLAIMLVLIIAGWGIFWLLVQLGVIVYEAGKPPHTDTLDYRLDQGREVGKDERRR